MTVRNTQAAYPSPALSWIYTELTCQPCLSLLYIYEDKLGTDIVKSVAGRCSVIPDRDVFCIHPISLNLPTVSSIPTVKLFQTPFLLVYLIRPYDNSQSDDHLLQKSLLCNQTLISLVLSLVLTTLCPNQPSSRRHVLQLQITHSSPSLAVVSRLCRHHCYNQHLSIWPRLASLAHLLHHRRRFVSSGSDFLRAQSEEEAGRWQRGYCEEAYLCI